MQFRNEILSKYHIIIKLPLRAYFLFSLYFKNGCKFLTLLFINNANKSKNMSPAIAKPLLTQICFYKAIDQKNTSLRCEMVNFVL